MYTDNIIICTSEYQIDIELYSLVNVIVGKALAVKMINNIKKLQASDKNSITYINMNLDDIIICNSKNDINSIICNNISGKTIIITDYDKMHSKLLNSFILSGNNRIILLSDTYYTKLKLHAESILVSEYNVYENRYTTERGLDHLKLFKGHQEI